MPDLPLAVRSHLISLALADHSPAYLVTDLKGRVDRWGGRLADFGLDRPRAGQELGQAVFFLEGLVPLEGEAPLKLARVQTPSGRHADIHIFNHAAEYWVLFLDVSAEVERAGYLQQEAHELSLLKDQLNKLLGAPQAAKQELVERVKDQIRIAGLTNRLLEANRELAARQAELDQDLEAAAEIQQALLPASFPETEGLSFAYRFEPCTKIGGDIFNVFPLDRGRVGLYMLDVSGHGVPAALVTVSVSQTLAPHGPLIRGPGQWSPGGVVEALDREYPMDRFDKMFSIVYLIIDPQAGKLTYCNAAHPHPLLLSGEDPARLLRGGGTFVGFGGLLPFEERTVDFGPGDRLFLYTDGVIEHRDPDGDLFGQQRLLQTVADCRELDIDAAVARIKARVDDFGQERPFADDVTVLGVQAA